MNCVGFGSGNPARYALLAGLLSIFFISQPEAVQHRVESDEICRCVARDFTGSEIEVPSIDGITCYFCGKPRRSR